MIIHPVDDGKYEETCDFTTENFQHVRGKSFPYNFKVDGDRWTLNPRAPRGEPERRRLDESEMNRLGVQTLGKPVPRHERRSRQYSAQWPMPVQHDARTL